MGKFIHDEQVAGLSPDESERIITEIETKAFTLVPRLKDITDPDIAKTVESMLLRCLTEWVREAGKIASQTTGPWSVSFVKGAVAAGVFPADVLSWLRRLSGGSEAASGLPRGSFPPPPDLRRLFSRRERPWRQ